MNHRRPRLSIGMPLYNAEKYLRRAADSLLAQTFEDFELILSDNASEDRTAEICLEYEARDPRVRFYRNGTNLGASKNFNRVFHAARGEFFMWAAHDDWWDKRFAEECIAVLDWEHTAVLCYSLTNMVDDKGEVIEVYRDTTEFANVDPEVRYRHILTHLNWCNSFYAIMRTDIAAQTPLVQRNNAAADNLFLADMALRGRFIQVEQPLFYRKKPNFAENLEQRYARIYSMDGQPGMGVTLPFCRWIKMHCLTVKDSDLAVDRKNRLIQLTIDILLKRYGAQIRMELQRAIGLITQGKVRTDWGGEDSAGTPQVDPQYLNFVYTNALLDDVEFAAGLFREFPGLNHARAVLYLMLGRNDEGALALDRELRRDPTFQPSIIISRRLRERRAAAAS